MQKEGDEPEEGDHCAKTSNARPNQPSQAAESSSLMSLLALVALRSAWFGRRRTHLVAKHRAVAILQDCEEDEKPMKGSGQNHWTAAIAASKWWG